MNLLKLTIIGLVTAVLLVSINGDVTPGERQGKYLRFNGIPDFGKFSFERVLSQWNRSTTEATTSMPYSSTEYEVSDKANVNVENAGELETSSDLYSLMEQLAQAFKKCIFSKKKLIVQSPNIGKDIIFQCFRVELIKELKGIVSEADTISLMKGYIQLEKVDKSRKKTVKKTISEHYSSSYNNNNNVRENPFYGKSSPKISGDVKKGSTKTGNMFSTYGKYLIEEINENFDKEEEQVRNLKGSFMDKDLVSVLSDMSRKFAVRFSLFPGVSARMMRSHTTGVTFDLELDDLPGFGGDDDDDEKKRRKRRRRRKGGYKGTGDDESSEEEDEEEDDDEDEDDDDDDDDEDDEEENDLAANDEEEEAEEDEDQQEQDQDEEQGIRKGKGKDKRKRKKGRSKMKKKIKMIKKIAPYLLIPLMIQAAMLPLAFKFLLFFAIKALIAGKIALLLVAINLIKNTNFKTDEEEYIERVGQDHYGYGKGEEYGAWFGKRSLADNPSLENYPYRAYAPMNQVEIKGI